MMTMTMMSKTCKKCGSAERYNSGKCKPCKAVYDRNRYAESPEKANQQRHITRLKCLYNLTEGDYNVMWQSQDSKCAICGKSEEINGRRLAVDHGHIKHKVRSLLCRTCNIGIGLFQDSSILLKKAADYLVKHEGDNLVEG